MVATKAIAAGAANRSGVGSRSAQATTGPAIARTNGITNTARISGPRSGRQTRSVSHVSGESAPPISTMASPAPTLTATLATPTIAPRPAAHAIARTVDRPADAA